MPLALAKQNGGSVSYRRISPAKIKIEVDIYRTFGIIANEDTLEMPTTKVIAKDVIGRLTEVFRAVGYEGATLSKLSEATGLQRASLYHRFPGGKKEMAEAVLSRAGDFFQKNILGPLKGPGTPKERLVKMGKQLNAFYLRGNASCLLDTLSFGDGRDIFESHIKVSFSCWIESIARLVAEATECSKTTARQRAEDAVIRIQGALVLGRGTGNTKAFQRILRTLPESLLKERR